MNKKILLITALLWLVYFANGQTSRDIVGYYPNWQWYDRTKLVNPLTINYSRYTVINYAFFNPQANGDILTTDQWADDNLLLGPMNWQNNIPDSTKSLPYNAHLNNVSVLASIGGWTLSGNFSAMASNTVARKNFAHKCVQLCTMYKFDGIDIDWEYPSAADKQNFTLLIQTIHDSLASLSVSTAKKYWLTAAISAAPSNMSNIEWPLVMANFDFVNLMSYDFYGVWDNITNHNSPLYAPAQGGTSFNCAAAVNSLLTTYGVQPSKLTMGIPFYGRSAKTINTPALFGSIDNHTADVVTFSEDDGTPLYYNLLIKKNLFSQHYDSTAKVPYLTGNGGLKTFVSFDDSVSVAQKAQFIIANNLRGAIIWEITGDYLETFPGSGIIAATPLADVIKNTFAINIPPSIVLNSPAANSTFVAPANISMSATATDIDGTIKNVKFYNGTTLLYTDATPPYTYVWNNVGVGSYTIKAKATDNKNAVKTVSRKVKVTAFANKLPVVTLTAPLNGATYSAPANIVLTATASDSDGVIKNVQFYNGITLLKTDTTAPYKYTWTNVPAGNYSLRAKATDNLGGVTFSAIVNVVVMSAGGNCNFPTYQAGTYYANGDTVKNNLTAYMCIVSGWCSSSSALYYEPGVGLAWQDAWVQAGTCSARMKAHSGDNKMEILNPVVDDLKLFISTNEKCELMYRVSDMMGSIIYAGHSLCTGKLSMITVDVSALPPAMYLIEVITNGNIMSQRFIKMGN